MSNENLRTQNPALAEEWHPTKNGALRPEQVAPKSNKKVWWLGKCGHEWEAKINSRSTGTKCPYCTNKKVLPGFNDLATVDRNLAAEWHPSKNGDLTPQNVTRGSFKKVWWLGKCGHEWEVRVFDRSRGATCPYCSTQKFLPGFNDLATVNPALAAEWHPSKNGDLTPQNVTRGSTKRVWWICPKGHEWEATVAGRKNGAQCPYCSNTKKALSGFDDLATVNPALAAEWHPTKNGDLTPQDVKCKERVRVWWRCSEGHEWQALVSGRSTGATCPYCSNTKQTLPGVNNLATANPSLAAEWHPTKNGDLTPRDVTKGANKKVWWLGKCGHEWEAMINGRSRGATCPYCANKKVLPGFNDLATANPSLAVEWHPSKNGELTPQEVTKGTNKKVWWLGKCGHEWEASVRLRTSGTGCPYCAGHHPISGGTDLASANPELAEQWHPSKNGDLTPHDVTSGSTKRVWWICLKGHEWEATVNSRKTGARCPYCSNKKALPGFNDLATANPALAAEWHPSKNGDLTPQNVTKGSFKKVWWQCSEGHEWQAPVISRTTGIGCPYCAGFFPIPGETDLATTSPALAAQWHPTKNGDLTPRDVKRKSRIMVWWLCPEGHEWEATVANRSDGSRCPYCAGKKTWEQGKH